MLLGCYLLTCQFQLKKKLELNLGVICWSHARMLSVTFVQPGFQNFTLARHWSHWRPRCRTSLMNLCLQLSGARARTALVLYLGFDNWLDFCRCSAYTFIFGVRAQEVPSPRCAIPFGPISDPGEMSSSASSSDDGDQRFEPLDFFEM